MEQNIPISLTSESHAQLAAQGLAFLKQEKPAKAQALYVRALLLDPENRQYKEKLVRCLPHITYQKFNSQAKESIFLCLNDPDITHRAASKSWLELIEFDPDMQPLVKLLGCNDYEDFKGRVDFNILSDVLNNEFFCIGLKKCLLMHLLFEPLIIYLRKFYLLAASAGQRKAALPFLCALATKCFSNEYVYSLDDNETNCIDLLKARSDLSLEELMVLACYVPLYQLEGSKEFSTMVRASHNDDVISVSRLQIDEPLEEKDIAQNIESFSPIEDAVSANVQAQYEEHPYPRWTNVTKPILTEEQFKKSEGKDILIAGCGTGMEPALHSARMPYASIDAIDLSRASMSYAIRASKNLDIENVRFLHGDLLDVGKLSKSYDLIFSSGVLHHMDKPALGLKALHDVLKPNGVLSIALYSELGRQDIAACQQWVKEQGYESTTRGMRKFRRDVMALDQAHPLKSVAFISDFYSASECRDLIFHVQEHRFTCLSIKQMIEELGLELLNFGVRVPRMKEKYLATYTDDPKGLSLENWHEFEQKNPNSFRRMYDLVLRRKDESHAQELPEWLKYIGVFAS